MASAGNVTPVAWPDDGIILYDGVCVLCSGMVRFVARRDPDRVFRFAPIQTPYGRALAETLGIDPDDPDSNAVVVDGLGHRRSDAAIAVLARLPGWRRARIHRLEPRPIRDAIYRLVARHRYRIFGRRDSCDLGGPDLRDRVIG